ncbi:histamine H2 receptor-like [Montipora capricornis]|uniref:histamine H2 receptor-like n=1 Tax=Montipora capricornis TaxID=246305 RepID=UPI0035F1AA83
MRTWIWIINWCLSILTITGNGVIIFLVFSKRQLRTKTNAFLVSLAVADFLIGTTTVPFFYFCEISKSCKGNVIWQFVVIFTRFSLCYASMMNLCSVVLDRFIAVVIPFAYLSFMTRRPVVCIISLAWVIAIGQLIFPMAGLVFSKPVFIRIHSIIVATFYEFLPCVTLVFCVGSMVRVVFNHKRAANTLAKQLRFNHEVFLKSQDSSTVKTTAIIVGFTLVCYSILMRCSMIYLVYSAKKCEDDDYKIPILISNSALNPLAYAFLKRDIKRAFKELTKSAF